MRSQTAGTTINRYTALPGAATQHSSKCQRFQNNAPWAGYIVACLAAVTRAIALSYSINKVRGTLNWVAFICEILSSACRTIPVYSSLCKTVSAIKTKKCKEITEKTTYEALELISNLTYIIMTAGLTKRSIVIEDKGDVLWFGIYLENVRGHWWNEIEGFAGFYFFYKAISKSSRRIHVKYSVFTGITLYMFGLSLYGLIDDKPYDQTHLGLFAVTILISAYEAWFNPKSKRRISINRISNHTSAITTNMGAAEEHRRINPALADLFTAMQEKLNELQRQFALSDDEAGTADFNMQYLQLIQIAQELQYITVHQPAENLEEGRDSGLEPLRSALENIQSSVIQKIIKRAKDLGIPSLANEEEQSRQSNETIRSNSLRGNTNEERISLLESINQAITSPITIKNEQRVSLTAIEAAIRRSESETISHDEQIGNASLGGNSHN